MQQSFQWSHYFDENMYLNIQSSAFIDDSAADLMSQLCCLFKLSTLLLSESAFN